LEEHIEKIVRDLKVSPDAGVRKELLRQLRYLIEEADTLLLEESSK
jgi:hypothetical protein